MENCLVRYFSINNDCPLPGIGSLNSKEQHAVLDIIDKRIEAPKSFVQFSYNELNDAALINLIQAEYQCDYNTAKEKLTAYVKRFTDLKPMESISIGALGVLRKSNSNQFELDAFPNLTNYQKDIIATRLVKINAPHAILVGDRETTREAMQEFYVEKEVVWKSKWWIASIVILAISTALILIHYFYFNGNDRFGNHLGF